MEDKRSFGQKMDAFLMKDTTFILLIMGAAAAIFAGTFLYIRFGTGAFNDISIVAMLRDGMDGGDYAAAAGFAAGFLIARVLEGPLVGLLDIGGSLQTGVGIGLPALFLSMGWELPFSNFFVALLTGAVIGLIMGAVIMIIRKVMPEGVAVGGTSVMMGAGVPVEAGTATEVAPEDIEEAITDKTAALMYVKSHHCVQKGMVDLPTMIEIAHRNGLPLLVDAAAEEDFRKYIAMRADLVCYSGAKALEATTSGFVTGKKEYIAYARKQYKGIGRAMKIGKEGIMGLLEALEQYEHKDRAAEAEKNKEIAIWLKDAINEIPGLRSEVIQDEAGRAIYRARIFVDPEKAGMTATELEGRLKEGDPTVRCRTEFMSLGKLDLDPRPLVEGDKELIVEKLRAIMEA
ncbi:MAG: DUF4310 family protein [Lachnospiraceae bacterium]|jgi:uncharacterized pyridoxal phosphate-dependent enzyme|nr:DUF4310 family protein [Lachnospiraceae bacterium]